MSVLVFAENIEGKFHKPVFEALTYAHETAKLLSTNVIAVSIGQVTDEQLNILGKYGASEVLTINDNKLTDFNAQAYTSCMEQAIAKTGGHQMHRLGLV